MLRAGHVVALCALALLTIGVVMVNSALMRVAPLGAMGVEVEGITPKTIILSRSTAYMALALMAMALAATAPIRRLSDRFARPVRVADDANPWADLRGPALGVACLLGVLALVYIPGLGKEVNGSSRWVRVPFAAGLSFQPSEIAKWGLVGIVAWYGTIRSAQLDKFFTGLLPGLALVGVVAAAVVLEDLGTGVLIAVAASTVLLAAGARFVHFLAFVPLGLLGVGAAILTSPYRIRRLAAFLDPFADPQGDGYHMIQSMAAIAGGEGIGRGLGNGLQKFGYLPEDHTDFLFAIVCEELGIAGAALVLALYATLLLAALAIVRREPSRLLKLAALGVLATIGVQTAMNLLVVTGLGPTKGIALPLMSSGGTGWILTALCLGVLVHMDLTRPEPALTNDPHPALRPEVAP